MGRGVANSFHPNHHLPHHTTTPPSSISTAGMEPYPTPQHSPQKPQQRRGPIQNPNPASEPVPEQKLTFEAPQITSPSDLTAVRLLGCGAWGRVVMAQISNSNSLVAVKVIPKKGLRLTGEMDKHEINVEKRHLSRLPWSPFLAGAVSAVSDSTNLSLALELIPHGTFHQLIDRFGPLNQLDASFYYSNIVCAIEFIHSRGLVSRDIKPENFLVGYDGYLVMTDLGIAEMVGEGGTWLDMGTSHYMPPELIQQGYPVGKAIDWWASGVVLYEMLTQTLPFQGDGDQPVYRNILAQNYKWPEEPIFGNSLKHFISRLLTFDPRNRLGYSDTREIMEHPWLSHVDWTLMRNRVYEAPWVPGGTEVIGKWHLHPMLPPASMGNMKVRCPPRYLRNDHRYPTRDFIVRDHGFGSESSESEDLDGSSESALSRVTNDP